MVQAIAGAEARPKTQDASRRCGDRRSSTGSGDGEASRSEAKQVRVDIAQGLSEEGCGSGPRSMLAHRRGPLSVCRHSVSADTIDIARRFVSGKPVGTHPEQQSSGMVNARRVRRSGECKGPARWRGFWRSSSSCQLFVMAFHGLGIEADLAPDLAAALG